MNAIRLVSNCNNFGRWRTHEVEFGLPVAFLAWRFTVGLRSDHLVSALCVNVQTVTRRSGMLFSHDALKSHFQAKLAWFTVFRFVCESQWIYRGKRPELGGQAGDYQRYLSGRAVVVLRSRHGRFGRE